MVSNIFFHPYLGKVSNLTNIFEMGWNHQLDEYYLPENERMSPKKDRFTRTRIIFQSSFFEGICVSFSGVVNPRLQKGGTFAKQHPELSTNSPWFWGWSHRCVSNGGIFFASKLPQRLGLILHIFLWYNYYMWYEINKWIYIYIIICPAETSSISIHQPSGLA